MDLLAFYMDFSNMAKLSVYKEEKFRSPLNTERDIGLWVDRIGSKNTSKKPSRLRQLGQFGAVFVERGQGYLINSRLAKLPIKSEDVILLLPREACAYYPVKDWNEKWIVWNGPDAYKIEELGYLNKSRLVVNDQFGIFRQTYDLLSKIISSESKTAILERKVAVLNMLSGLFKLHEQNTHNQHCENTVENAIVFLQQNFHKNISIPELAERVNYSNSYFRKVFRDYTGRSPREFITTLRMSKAKELLLQNKKIKEVAKIVGYDDIFYFMRIFRTVTGISPGKWQKYHI
jgi:AraC-like DNA-binding protein